MVSKLFSLRMLAVAALSVVFVACAPAAAPVPSGGVPAQPTTPAQPVVPTAEPTTPAAAVPVATEGMGIVNGPLASETKALNGAGATFPAVLYSKWFDEYRKLTGVEVNYQAIGSGGGIKSISDKTVDFGGTDGPMSDEKLQAAKGGHILHIPAALGAVVPTYNVPEFAGTNLKFSAETVSGIYLGQITKWNDAKIAADNVGVALPDKDIIVIHRSDGSGTSYIFTDYLSSVSAEWADNVGTGTSVNWPVGLGGKGNAGVAGEVKQNPYSIGYVELIYAVQNNLGVGWVKNKAGNYIEPTLDAVSAAAAGAAAHVVPDLRASIVNEVGDKSYPISGFTWLLAYQNQTDKAKAEAMTRMLWWATHDAQKFNADLSYAPVPPEIGMRSEELIKSIKVDGRQAFPH